MIADEDGDLAHAFLVVDDRPLERGAGATDAARDCAPGGGPTETRCRSACRRGRPARRGRCSRASIARRRGRGARPRWAPAR
eukprot:1247173-Prymnesium_polylepis.1